MRAGLLLLCVIARAQSPAPSFTADGVLPSGRDRVAPLTPGMLISIYGRNLGPEQACVGRQMYPRELCGVQVFVGGHQAGLLYVQEKQINFQAPQEAPLEGTTELKVVYEGRSNSSVRIAFGPETATLSVEGVARAAGPVWIKIDLPQSWAGVQYPVGIHPADFGCHQFEVRRNGALLPRIVLPGPTAPRNGPACGYIGIPGHPIRRTGRLPLHLQYRFDKPGIYEVRYTRTWIESAPTSAGAQFRSAWTPINVVAATPQRTGTLPSDPAEALSDFLPNILAASGDASLQTVLDALYYPNEIVRQYSALALQYWPQNEIDRRLEEILRTKGPSDAVVDRTLQRKPELIDAILPYFRSPNPALLRGAITGAYHLLGNQRQSLPVETRARAEAALLAAADHVIAASDNQTVTNLAAAFGVIRNEKGRDALWNFVERRVALGQSLIAITWRKDPRDLPRLGLLVEAPATGDPLSADLSSLPYALRNAYGDAALPFLESAIRKSGHVWVRTNCARELILADRPAGFAFIVETIERNQFYKREMIEFVRSRFSELRTADDNAILKFVKARAQ